MPPPRSDLNALARRLLSLEEAEERPSSVASALESTFGKLVGDVAQMVGADGASAMAARALTQAQRDFPVLEGIAPDPDPPHRLKGGEAALSRVEPEDAEAAAAAAIERFLEILVALLGTNLGLRPARSIWPAAFYEHESQPTEEGE